MAFFIPFLASLAVYCKTLCPSVAHGHDSGELTTAAYLLGVAHPPGYPLYVRLGWLWCRLLPGDNPAWKMNLFAAVCVAAAAGLLSLTLRRQLLTELKSTVDATSTLAGMVAAFMFAFAYSTWNQAVGAEVFGLHLLLLAGLAWTAVAWLSDESTQSRRRHMTITSILFGLGASHHHTLVLAAPGMLLAAWLTQPKVRQWGLSWWMVPSFLLSSVPLYWHTMLVARSDPPLNWGSPDNWSAIKEHFLRKAYGTFQLSATLGQRGSGEAHSQGYWISLCRRQFPFPAVGLALPSLWFPASRRAPLVAMLLLWAIIYGPGFSLLGQQTADEFHLDMQERFYTSSYFAVAGLCGLGLASLLRLRPLPWSLKTLVFCVPLLGLVSNWEKCSQAGQYQAYDTMKAQLAICPPNSLYVVSGDLPAGACDYLQMVEHFRPDVATIFPGLVVSEWHQRRLPEDLRQRMPVSGGSHDTLLHCLCLAQIARGGRVLCNQPITVPGHHLRYGILYEWFPKNKIGHPDQYGVAHFERQKYLDQELRLLEQLRVMPLRGQRLFEQCENFWSRYHLRLWHSYYQDTAKLLNQEDARATLAALNEQFKLKKPNALELCNRGLLHYYLGGYQLAEADQLAALQEQPDFVYSLAALSDLYYAMANPSKAREYQERVLVLRQKQKTAGDPPQEGPTVSRFRSR